MLGLPHRLHYGFPLAEPFGGGFCFLVSPGLRRHRIPLIHGQDWLTSMNAESRPLVNSGRLACRSAGWQAGNMGGEQDGSVGGVLVYRYSSSSAIAGRFLAARRRFTPSIRSS